MTTSSLRQIRSARARAQWQGQRAEREAGLAWARAWRERNKPNFDARFGPEHPAHERRS